MSLLTEDQVRGWARARLTKSWRTDSVVLKDARAQTGSFHVFLSHAFLDKELVVGLYNQLVEYGLRVYVDWVEDAQLDRTHVTTANAALLRQRIKESASVLFAVSQNASTSVWMPWEVGFGDGAGRKVAVIPILKNVNVAAQTVHQEYLGLYPTVDSTGTGGSFWVNFQNGGVKPLKDWLGP